ncbi:MAG: dienelactone hydrolase family protein [Isosphaeraceae bacterium]
MATASRVASAICLLVGLMGAGAAARADDPAGSPLPGTQPLTMQGDIASELVAGVDRFLLRKIDESVDKRGRHWKRDFSSAEAYNRSIKPNRKRLAHILGVRDQRVPQPQLESVRNMSEVHQPLLSGKSTATAIRWPAFGDVHGEGLILLSLYPTWRVDAVIVIPDADQTPEQLAGLVPGVPRESQVAQRLAESGCMVYIPMLIDRKVEPRNGRAKLTSREFVHRSAFELGRHLIGYEVQKVLALVDEISKSKPTSLASQARIGIFGYGEGGAIALYAAAIDPRISAVCVSGYFDNRNSVWSQPVDRNVFGLLDQFGDAELACMIAPRPLIIEAAKGPEVTLPPGTGGAPGKLTTPKLDTVKAEIKRARELVHGLVPPAPIDLVTSGDDGKGPFGTEEALTAFLNVLAPGAKLYVPGVPFKKAPELEANARQARQLHELDRHNQQLLVESPYVRAKFMEKLDTKSLEAYEKTIEPYREFFAKEVIGRFDDKMLPPNVRSRKVYDEPKYTGYEVVLDVFPDVIAYGILLLPRDIKAGEKRPVVVCQHGLEGRPQDVADPKVNSPYYHQFANRLAEQGFITFAPQNLYIFQDRFRTLQRKANPLGKTLFSIIVPQHQQITDWLKTLPQVDPARIAFYGLSYGGKSAMRIPPLVKNYCLSICSGDFNEWVWKNASTRGPYSYVWTGEYEIFEFDLGSTFNYAEMAALIAPRPFMVERGHFDGVAPDETVAYEFAKVFHLYDGRLNIGDRCQIEYFRGPHMINGKGTFKFLHEQLKWAER